MQTFTDASHTSSSLTGNTVSGVHPPFGLPIDNNSPLYPLPSTFSIRSRTSSNDILGTLTLHPNGSCATSDTQPATAGQWTWTPDFPSSDADVLATVRSTRGGTAAGGFLAFSTSESPKMAVWAIPTLTEDFPSSRFWIRRVWPAGSSESNAEDDPIVVLPKTAGMLVRKRN